MANYNKKGWNALMLSEFIDGKCIIPKYIQDALIFVARTALLEKRNYLKLMHQYGKVYNDVNLLTIIDEQPEISLEKLLEVADVNNSSATVIKLLNKVVEK